MENFILRWYVELTALRLFKVERLSIVLYEEGAFTTIKSAIVAEVLGAFPARTDSMMNLIGWMVSPMKPLSGIGAECSRSGLIPILTKAS